MEDYGVGGATKMGLLIFQQASRRSGRTSRLIERVGPRDWIIVQSASEARLLKRKLQAAGKAEVAVHVVEPACTDQAWNLGTNPHGVTHFEAGWVERYFLGRLECAQADLATLQGALSKNRRAPDPADIWSRRSVSSSFPAIDTRKHEPPSQGFER